MKNNSEPRVQVFGENVSTEKDRYEYGDFSGGLIFLTAGIILLLNNLNIIPWKFWNFVLVFWPVFFILAGIKIILGRNTLSNFVALIVTLLSIAFVVTYGLIRIGSPLLPYIPANFVEFITALTGRIP